MWSWIKWFFGWDAKVEKPSEAVRECAPGKPNEKVEPWYYSATMRLLLALIREFEAGKAGYNADYKNDDRWTLSNYTLDRVIQLAKQQVMEGEASSAIGGYQFLSKTLVDLRNSLDLSGGEQFTERFQDELAIALMNRRGLMDFLRGQMSLTNFCNQLAKEWASLPVVTDIVKPNGKKVKAGQSYYAGDGLNKSFHTPKSVMDAVTAMGNELRQRMPKGDSK